MLPPARLTSLLETATVNNRSSERRCEVALRVRHGVPKPSSHCRPQLAPSPSAQSRALKTNVRAEERRARTETKTVLVRRGRVGWWMRVERFNCFARGVYFPLDAIGEQTGIGGIGLSAGEFVGESFDAVQPESEASVDLIGGHASRIIPRIPRRCHYHQLPR